MRCYTLTARACYACLSLSEGTDANRGVASVRRTTEWRHRHLLDRYDASMVVEALAEAGYDVVLRDARQDPQPTSDPEPAPSDDIDFDALPIGTVLKTHNGYYVTKGGNGNWFDGEEAHAKPETILAPYTVVYQPAPLSPRQCLEALLAGRDDADELIEHAAKEWHYGKDVPERGWRLRGAIGDAARGGA